MQFESADLGFFVDNPAWSSLLGFSSFTRMSTGTTNLDDQPIPFCPPEKNTDNPDSSVASQDLTTEPPSFIHQPFTHILFIPQIRQ